MDIATNSKQGKLRMGVKIKQPTDYHRQRLIEHYLQSEGKLEEFKSLINNNHYYKPINKANKKIKIAYKIVTKKGCKTIFDSDFSKKISSDNSYLNLFYFWFSSRNKKKTSSPSKHAKRILFIPTNLTNRISFYWYKFFLIICHWKKYQIIATSNKKWFDILCCFKLIMPYLAFVQVVCRKGELFLQQKQNAFYAEQYIFPCFDKKCIHNKLFRMILLADLVVLESCPKAVNINFILDICSAYNKRVFYKATFGKMKREWKEQNIFFKKNSIKKLTLNRFLHLKWDY